MTHNEHLKNCSDLINGVATETIKIKLYDLTFDDIKKAFPKHYVGKYPSEISFPNTDDSSRTIVKEGCLEDWKKCYGERFGNMTICLHPNETIWFKRVSVEDDEFNKSKDSYCQAKAKAMQEWSRKGYSID